MFRMEANARTAADAPPPDDDQRHLHDGVVSDPSIQVYMFC